VCDLEEGDLLSGANAAEEGIEVSDLVSVAKVSEISGVFKTVVSELGAALLERGNGASEAREFLWKGDWGLEERGVASVELSIDLGEDGVEVFDGVFFSL